MPTNPRNTVYMEDAEVLAHDLHPGDQYVLRLHAPRCAANARPGSFAHLRCDPALPMRRPFSLMRVSREQGWVDILYKIVGTGTAKLARHWVGDRVSLMGPIGNAFIPHAERPLTLLLGGGVGIPPVVFLADALRNDQQFQPLVILGSEVPFPFEPQASRLQIAGIPEEVDHAMPLMENWRIASRLASNQGFAGCYAGHVTALADQWLKTLSRADLDKVEIFGCGPHAMLEAVALLARSYNLPCQVALEEYMACAVGGCAGCTVKVKTEAGEAMKRVCVDGPVFEAASVF